MKFIKLQNNKNTLSVFGKNQVSDWHILWKGAIIILILTIIFGLFIYQNITTKIRKDVVESDINTTTVNVEKVDKLVNDFEVRKNNFDRLIAE